MADFGRDRKNTIYIDFLLDRQLHVVIQTIHPSLKRGSVAHCPHVLKVVKAGGAKAARRMPKLVIANYIGYCNLTNFSPR